MFEELGGVVNTDVKEMVDAIDTYFNDHEDELLQSMGEGEFEDTYKFTLLRADACRREALRRGMIAIPTRAGEC